MVGKTMTDYYYKPIKEFMELNSPKHSPFGWYVMTTECTTDDLYFLGTDAQVRVRDKTTGFFFKSELAAHYAAVAYYNYHREGYPHGVAMMETVLPVNKSQVMEFE